MLLAIDIGNTHIVLGIFKQTRLLANWRLTTSTGRTEDEIWSWLHSFCTQAEIPASDITGAVISSVVPDQTYAFQRMTQKYLKIAPIIISSKLDIGMKIRYDDPSTVGADRLCNAAATYNKYGGPAIIIDFGTATTYDVISKRGDYLGGVIATGVETSAAELHRRAAKLPKIELQFPKKIIGVNTVSSMQAGILYGAVDAMEGIVRRIKKEIGTNAKVIATGGYAQLIAQGTKIIDRIEPSLVLDGARIIYEKITHRKAAAKR
jgi:type III pantothenate kinase